MLKVVITVVWQQVSLMVLKSEPQVFGSELQDPFVFWLLCRYQIGSQEIVPCILMKASFSLGCQRGNKHD